MPGCKIVFVVLLPAFLTASSVPGMQSPAPAGTGRSEAVTVRFEEPSDEALSRVERVRATRMGVDRSGNFWAWSRASRRLQVLSPAGGLVYGETLEPAVAVDFDAEYGVAVLAMPPDHAYIAGSDGSMRHRIETPPDATDIVWLDADRVAIALAESDHSVEVWNLCCSRAAVLWGNAVIVYRPPGFPDKLCNSARRISK